MGGRSRPFARLNAPISAALARLPRIARARLPGITCCRTNVTAVTPSTTITAWTIRRSRYPITSSLALREVPLLGVDEAVGIRREAAQVRCDGDQGAWTRLPEVWQLEPDRIGVRVERCLGLARGNSCRRDDQLVDRRVGVVVDVAEGPGLEDLLAARIVVRREDPCGPVVSELPAAGGRGRGAGQDRRGDRRRRHLVQRDLDPDLLGDRLQVGH